LNEKDQNENVERVQICQRIEMFIAFPSCSTVPSNADKYLCCGLLLTLTVQTLRWRVSLLEPVWFGASSVTLSFFYFLIFRYMWCFT